MRQGIAILYATMLILPTFLIPLLSSEVVKPKALVLCDNRIVFDLKQYGVFRNLLSGYADVKTLGAWDLPYIYSHFNLSDWLDYEGYELIVFLGCRFEYFDYIKVKR